MTTVRDVDESGQKSGALRRLEALQESIDDIERRLLHAQAAVRRAIEEIKKDFGKP